MGTPYRLFVGRPSKQPPHTRQTDKIPRGKKKRGAQKNTSAAAVGSLERSEEQPSVRGVVDVLNVLGVLGRECHLPRFFGRRRGSRTGNSDRGPGTSPTLIGRELSSWEVFSGAVSSFLGGCECRLLQLRRHGGYGCGSDSGSTLIGRFLFERELPCPSLVCFYFRLHVCRLLQRRCHVGDSCGSDCGSDSGSTLDGRVLFLCFVFRACRLLQR